MAQDLERQIQLLNQALACFEAEVAAKDDLIKSQENRIRMLQEHNAKLKALIERILNSR